ncbi:Scramblase-domain-containing protein [Radiomyces spectabilis]|uniref:Scramblase-domain-containing protein n=1 Tax=Radiomyces spectabilis TaxID=64574 RepID=UPI00221F0A2F|nr:Scramblase-domain-containing protein [Radiomyces spectabilis]KAI8381257.1 Scramblase-domain-containing protein [Radiomyces spectabilis]
MYRPAFRQLGQTAVRRNHRVLSKLYEPAVRWQALEYSSLRNGRQLGPRGRILNHVERSRIPPRPTQLSEATPAASSAASSIPTETPSNVIIKDDDRLSADPAHTLVEIPQREGQIITPDYHGAPVLSQSALVVGREFEMMNIFLGYEQANKYKMMDPNGNLMGYIAEEEGLAKALSRQFLRTHRPFNATIMDVHGNVIFKISRPFAFINSRIFIHTSDDQLIGEVQQRWHLLRRKYDLFIGKTQFASIDTPFLGWDFYLQDEQGGLLGNVSRNFVGFARELFTDTGQYVLRMDAVEGNARGMTLDERAVTLACAISIDFDYFSRHSSHGGGGFLPFPFFGFGGGEREGEAGTPEDQGAPGASNEPSAGPSNVNIPPNESPSPFNEPPRDDYGDGWLSDEEAGVSSPSDSGFFDSLQDFFGDDD